MTRVWQIASGTGGRSYSDVFLKYGVGLIGPGDPGSWNDERSDVVYGHPSVRRFASPAFAQPGEIVLLLSGRIVVKTVGLIASEYLYLSEFDDVYGWDLQHARRIRWGLLPADHDFRQPVFGIRPRRFNEVRCVQPVEFAHHFVNSEPTDWKTAPLPALPTPEVPLTDIPQHLQGLVELAKGYWGWVPLWQVSENETIAHFIVPFFCSLGWPPELRLSKYLIEQLCYFLGEIV